MSNDIGREQSDKKVLHLEETERLPRDARGLPAVPASSQAAEVVKQIIEQILVNERRRARIEFFQISVFFLVFLFAILGTGIWFARQLLGQMREERRLTEQTWRMMAGGGAASSADKMAAPPDQAEVNIPPALNHQEIAQIEQNIKTASRLLKTRPQNSSASIRDMLQSQQMAIQALSARLSETQVSAPEENKPVDFIAAPLAEDLKLRMPIPSL